MTSDADLEEQFRAFLRLMERAEETALRALEFARAASAQSPKYQNVLQQAQENYQNALVGRKRAEDSLRNFHDTPKR